LRVPADEIEAVVLDRLQRLLTDGGRLFELLGLAGADPGEVSRVLVRAREAARRFSEKHAERIPLVRSLIERIVVDRLELQIAVSRSDLRSMLQIEANAEEQDETSLTIALPIKLKRSQRTSRLIIVGDGPQLQRAADPALVRLIVRAHAWLAQLTTGQACRLRDIALLEKVTSSYVARVLHVASLSPDIVESILVGQQPANSPPTG
jgi:hypothetical protein